MSKLHVTVGADFPVEDAAPETPKADDCRSKWQARREWYRTRHRARHHGRHAHRMRRAEFRRRHGDESGEHNFHVLMALAGLLLLSWWAHHASRRGDATH
jgi:hypothetical protein